ncbi:MAG TPA: beta-galactosidase GalB [Rhodothermales bacterium]
MQRALLLSALVLAVTVTLFVGCRTSPVGRRTIDFNADWRFHLGDLPGAESPEFADTTWRELQLPHDWSIEGPFSPDHPATPGGGALPGGVGWYRKTFAHPAPESDRRVFVEFDGIYRNGEVWINGHRLGIRPNGYISYRYDLTDYLEADGDSNVIAVRVDNSAQPNSRWYSGSGIYRNVRLVMTPPVYVDHWGTFVTTPNVTPERARVVARTKVRNATQEAQTVRLQTLLFDDRDREVVEAEMDVSVPPDSAVEVELELHVDAPSMWSVDAPYLYNAVSRVSGEATGVDEYVTPFGIRTFAFDPETGFSLNGRRMKIQGVCNHHDLGALGAAVNVRAIERQLDVLRGMGVNAIRTAHNPPAPELLDLADRMGFLVMDEAFDMWRRGKSPYDYSLYWDEWHERDLRDFILRDRNHPSVILWSIGNEILEQWDSTGIEMTRELARIVRELDPTRPVTAGNNEPNPWNNLIRSGALDVIGFNYAHASWTSFPERFPRMPFIATETTSALATRGSYDMPSDSVRVWPEVWNIPAKGNPDFTCSSYDNCRVGWGSTHQEALRIVRDHDFVSGMFVWTGFDYLGEPTPYDWPARSSYFGIVDLAGFPKDAYYLYKSLWTDEPVLHLLPHWNWSPGDTIDVWAYTSAEEVSLYLNDRLVGTQRKGSDDLHLAWRVPFVPGTLRAVAANAGGDSLEAIVRTAGAPAGLELLPDRATIHADGRDLSFVTVNVLDDAGVLVPYADNLIQFDLQGDARIAAVDNGSQTSHEPFQSYQRSAFNGKALVIVQAGSEKGVATLTATAPGLEPARVTIRLE